ncbi:MAG: CheR family methyltransferase [Burkholderiaceae bacterium]
MNQSPGSSAVQRLRALVGARLGLRFDERQLPWLAEVLTRRLAHRRAGHAAALLAGAATDYLDRLEQGGDPGELHALAAELTVGETYFFRNSEQFLLLRQRLLPALIEARRGPRRLRVLSAGCASGEEAYSLAICLQTALSLQREAWDWQVLGFDLNPQVLEKARLGRYGPWSLREAPEGWLHSGLQPRGDEFEVAAPLRQHVSFQQRNICSPDAEFWQPGAFDLIFCRNMLMYLTPGAMQAAVAHLAGALAPDGYLFLGHAESLRDYAHLLQLQQGERCFFYRPQRSQAQPLREPAAPHPLPDAPLPAPQQDPTPARQHALQALLRQERHAEALRLADALAEETPQDPEVLLPQALLLTQQARIAEAQAVCQRLLALPALLPAQRAATHYVQALCREAGGDIMGAERGYRQAAALDPQFAMPRLRLGLLARRRGEQALMRAELARAALLLQAEDERHLLLFGGGFGRAALLALCRGDLRGDLRGALA